MNNNHITRSGWTFPYGAQRTDMSTGLNIPTDDTDIPAALREAELKHQDALATEREAQELLGTVTRQLAEARAERVSSRADHLADGTEPPADDNAATLREARDDAEELCQAARLACQRTEVGLFDAIKQIHAEGTQKQAAAAISARADKHLAEARALIAEAEAARNNAAATRSLSRLIDALPTAGHNAIEGTPTASPDAWRIARHQIKEDLQLIEESVPLSVLVTRPELQHHRVATSKKETTFK